MVNRITETPTDLHQRVSWGDSSHSTTMVHIKACQEAITDSVELFGYSPWSAFDLISTHQGITKRYGFIYVNRDNLI